MLPTAVVPCAVPGMDKAATAQDCSALLRGVWFDAASPDKAMRCDASRLIGYPDGDWLGYYHLAPVGRGYILTMVWEDGERPWAYLDFQGQKFRAIQRDGISFWRRRPAPLMLPG